MSDYHFLDLNTTNLEKYGQGQILLVFEKFEKAV